MVAVSRITVNRSGRGGTAPDPIVWDQGGMIRCRNVDGQVCGEDGWCTLDGGPVTPLDFTFLSLQSFLASCCWPVGEVDEGKFGVLIWGIFEFLVWNC